MAEAPALAAPARSAFSGAAAALGVGIFGLPQPFLAVLATTLIAPPLPGETARRIAGAWLGCALGVAILALFPQQPRFAFPALAIAGGLAARTCLARLGAGPATLFSMGLAASFPAGAIVPRIEPALAHGASLTIAALASAAAANIWKRIPAARPPSQLASPFGYGIALVLTVCIGLLAFPENVVPMSVCAAVVSLGLCAENGPGPLGRRWAGALVGTAAGALFILAVAPAESFPVFLCGLAAALWAFEAAAQKWPGTAAGARQAAGMFAVVGTMLPRPDRVLEGAVLRGGAVLVGFSIAVLVAGAARRALARPRAMAHDAGHA